MARPRKSQTLSFAEQLENIDIQIANHEKCIEDLKTQRIEIESQKRQSDLEALYTAAINSGKSIEDIIAMIQPVANPT